MFHSILCIDDDPITLMIYKKVISRANFSENTFTATNGKEALDFFDTIKQNCADPKTIPQLIFLDLNMPVMDGWEFLNQFETSKYNDFRNIKIIILSSTIDPAELEKIKKHHSVIDLLPKPINNSMLDYLTNKLK